MRQRHIALAVCAAMLPMGTTAAHAERGTSAAWLSCDFQGTAKMTPALTLTSRHVRFSSNVRFSNCNSSDATVRGGTAHTSGNLTGSCAVALGQATQLIRWSNHRRTRVVATFVNAGAEVVREEVVRGEFTGAMGGNANAVLGPPSALTDCAGRGVTSARFTGHIVLART